jgi:small conductance mechanosensitive channel
MRIRAVDDQVAIGQALRQRGDRLLRISPDGSISHTMRGAGSAAISAGRSATVATRATCAIASRAAALASKATTSIPPAVRRRVMFAPILPTPTMPICIAIPPLGIRRSLTDAKREPSACLCLETRATLAALSGRHAMNPQHIDTVTHFLQSYALPFAWRIFGAIALWIVGGWLIRIFLRVANNAMAIRHVDKTLASYASAAIRVALRIVLCIAILGVFGIETTSLAALLAAAGIAIGTAWSGLLSNFAAGVFLVVLRPFRVGDVIQAAGVTGEVKNIGLFMTALNTGENLRTFVGNSKVLAENIVNYTTNGFRRVDLRAQLAYGVDPRDAIMRLTPRVTDIANVLPDPAPQIAIQEFTAPAPSSRCARSAQRSTTSRFSSIPTRRLRTCWPKRDIRCRPPTRSRAPSDRAVSHESGPMKEHGGIRHRHCKQIRIP